MELKSLHSDNKDFFIGYVESRTGGRTENQDAFDFKQTERGFLVTVCDGMGGGPGGKLASNIAVHEIIAGVEEADKEEESINVIIKAIRRANIAIIEAGNENPSLKGMGTTATVLLFNQYCVLAAHVGDSRIYQLRRHKKVFRTFDHSAVFELVQQHIITEEQARLSVQSNIITRALGIKPDVEVDTMELPYLRGDRFLLCTDGIHGAIPETELIKMISRRGIALGAVVDDVATCIDNLGRDRGGGHDNLTLAVIETKINSKLKPKMSKIIKLELIGLIIMLVVSIAFNVVQYNQNEKMSNHIGFDSISVKQMENKMQQIDGIVVSMDNSNYQEKGNEIREIIRNNNK